MSKRCKFICTLQYLKMGETIMIRKLEEKDRGSVLGFLGKEPSYNLFMIGDIEAFGFEEDFQELWGQYDEAGALEGVLLRFNESFIPYFADNGFDNSGFKDIIISYEGKKLVSGKESVLKSFEGILPGYTARTTFFCELTDGDRLKPAEENNEIKIAGESDAERVYDLIHQIDEFSGLGSTTERIAHKIRTKTGRVYYIENDAGMMVSVVQTTAENSMSAMVVGVATLKEYRGQGFMSRCLSKLCRDILSEGRTLCLFYDNPEAGKVYHRLGFRTIGNWMMITASKE